MIEAPETSLPEEAAMQDQHTLHLIDANADEALHCIKGIKAAAVAANVRSDLKHCKGLFERFIADEGPQLIARSDDLDKLKVAVHALETNSADNAKGGIDLPPEELAALHARRIEAEEVKAAYVQEVDPVIKTALTLLAGAEGNPLGAHIFAGQLEKATEDELYSAVQDLYRQVFPMLEKAKARLVMDDE